MNIKADKTVDARGSSCPGPLLEAKKAIGGVNIGQVIEILSNDEGSKKDIPAWAAKIGHECIGVEEGDEYDKIYVKRLK